MLAVWKFLRCSQNFSMLPGLANFSHAPEMRKRPSGLTPGQTVPILYGMEGIRKDDRISWQRTYDETRMYGRVMGVARGVYLVKADGSGLYYSLHAKDVKREEKR